MLLVYADARVSYLGDDQAERAGRNVDSAERHEVTGLKGGEIVFRLTDDAGNVEITADPAAACRWGQGRGPVRIDCIKVADVQ